MQLEIFEAEAGLLRVYTFAGGSVLSDSAGFVGWSRIALRVCGLGGRCHGESFFGPTTSILSMWLAQFFFFYFFFPPSCYFDFDSNQCMRTHGFTEARWSALYARFEAVVHQGPFGPIFSLEPWTRSIPLYLYGFVKWVMVSQKGKQGSERIVAFFHGLSGSAKTCSLTLKSGFGWTLFLFSLLGL